MIHSPNVHVIFYIHCLDKYLLDDNPLLSVGYDLKNFTFVEEPVVADVFHGT